MVKRFSQYIIIGLILSGIRQSLLWLFPNNTVQALMADSLLKFYGSADYANFTIGVVIFALVAACYEFVDLRLPGEAKYKGLYYSLSSLLIWLVYTTEPTPLFEINDQLKQIIIYLILALVMAYLLGRWVANERLHYRPQALVYGPGLLIFSILMMVGRFISQIGLGLYPTGLGYNYALQAIWSFLAGFVLGLVYLMLQNYWRLQGPVSKALSFTIGFFCANLLVTQIPLLIEYDFSFWAWLFRVLIDLVMVYLATYATNLFQKREMTRLF